MSNTRPLKRVSFVFPMQVMCSYSRELFLSNYILFTCIHVSTHKKTQSVKFPLDLWENRTYNLNRAIDCPMVIRISEFGKLLLVEYGIREFFSWNRKSLALDFNNWNPKSITWISESPVWTPESKSVSSCVFCLISSIQQSYAAFGNNIFKLINNSLRKYKGN